ncbi:PAS domain S-box protein [uncultured Methylibium sp.]|uniref:PAS domain S-box protein n=1 Tax=uncultured Methylibium sp. TaxID=381093 RepID=UPI0025F75643|nr:PAS domain S-box protein [uncultured Methylibium sp.]
MKPAPLPADEADRLRLLQELRLFETDVDPAFAAIARLVCLQSGWPAGGISIVDAEQQRFLAAIGLDAAIATPRDLAFCSYTLCADDAFEVADTHQDARFRDHPMVVEPPFLRAYVGQPVRVDGHSIGSVFVIDEQPRRLDDRARAALRDLGELAGSLLTARLRAHRASLLEERVSSASQAGSDWLWESDVDGYLTWVSDSAEAHTGESAAAEIGRLGRVQNQPPGEEHQRSYERYLRARAERRPFKDAVALRDTPRGALLISMSGLPVFDDAGVFQGYRGAARDVTAELAQRSAAERTQQLLREAIERVAAGVMVSSEDGRILMSNAEWRASIMRYVPTLPEHWPDLVQALVDAGIYPDARGREAEFVAWRLALPTLQGQQHELRFGNEHVLVTDQRLPDGSVIHLSIDITPRRRAELALAEQESRLSAVLRALPDLWFVLDRDGRYLECSDDHHPALLRPFAEMRGRPFAEPLPDRIDAARIAQAERAIRDAPASGEVQRYEYALVTRDGRHRQFEARIAPMSGDRVLYLARDVTERTHAARQLELSEALYRSVADSISDGLLVVAPDGGIVTANPSACALLGARAQSLTGQRLSRIGYQLCFEDGTPVPMPEHPVAEVLKTGRSALDRVHRLRRPDGSERLVRLSALPMRLQPDDAQVSCVVTFRDITAQRSAEAALAQAEARWRFALEGAGDGVWDYDEEGGQVFYSPRWKTMLGYRDNEIGGSLLEWSRRVHPDDYPPVREAIRRYRNGESDEYRTEHRLRHKEGHWIWVLDRARIVERRADGTPRRVVGIHTDITRLKAAEEALRDKQAAELASRAKTEFLSRMSHEMRTPLNAVIGFAQLLQMSGHGGASATQVTQFSEHILSSGRHLLALVNDVLDLQQVEEGRLTLRLESVRLQSVVDGALELIGPQAAARRIAIDREVDPVLRVRADAQRLRQVLLNILSNGVKYNREGGRLRCVLEQADDARCVLLIEDSGPGLSPAEQARLFQPFERLGRETSSVEGTGLGLIISRRLVQEMGGELELSSQIGRGTQVRITLPLARDDDPLAASTVVAAAETSLDPASATAPLRMLYVEDNRLNAILFEEAIKRHGDIELRIAEDGPEALALVRDWPPQVLVLDANLPSMSGYELLRHLRALPPLAGTPAFMCSADALPSDLERAREAGFTGYWTKPIDIERVIGDLDALRTATA